MVNEVTTCAKQAGCQNRAHTSGTCFERYLELSDEPGGPEPMGYFEWLTVTNSPDIPSD
jgi:hypothetical protein